jgi:hypothetical protein
MAAPRSFLVSIAAMASGRGKIVGVSFIQIIMARPETL